MPGRPQARVFPLAHQWRYDWFARLAGAQGLSGEQRQARIEEGYRVVVRVVARTRERFPSADIIGFAGLSVEGRFATAFENAGASYFRGLMAEAERHGPIDCRPLDGHWNHRGHEVIGRLLQSRLFASKSGASAR